MKIFRYSAFDAIPLSITALQASWTYFLADRYETLSALELGVMFPFYVIVFWYNPIISTHNFLHTPFFESKKINRMYAAFNSINLGLPQILYRYHHLNHHAFNNDRRGPDGKTRDRSSTFAYGKDGQHEHVFPYAALGLFRDGTTEAFDTVIRKKQTKQLVFETIVCAGGLMALFALSWEMMIFFWLPAFYLGWFLAHVENYYEHYGAVPESKYANAVSHYGTVYNLLMCNEGYHQEHHLRPQTHWTRRPEVATSFAEELRSSRRKVSAFPPLLGFLDSMSRSEGGPDPLKAAGERR